MEKTKIKLRFFQGEPKNGEILHRAVIDYCLVQISDTEITVVGFSDGRKTAKSKQKKTILETRLFSC